jgi:hypothetical protein
MLVDTPTPIPRIAGRLQERYGDVYAEHTNPVLEIREMVQKLKHSRHLHEEWPAILDKISAFVTAEGKTTTVAKRLLACGYLRIKHVMVVGPSALSEYVQLEKSALNRLFLKMNFKIEDRTDVYSKIQYAIYFPEYPGLFAPELISGKQMQSLTFRIPADFSISPPFKMSSEEVALSSEIKKGFEDIVSDVCAPNVTRFQMKSRIANLIYRLNLAQKEITVLRQRVARYEIREEVDETDKDEIVASVAQEESPHPGSPPVQQGSNTPNDLLNEMNQLALVAKTRRRYSTNMWKFAFLIDRICPHDFPVLGAALPFPEDSSVRSHWKEERNVILKCVQCSEPESLYRLLGDYRRVWEIPPGQFIPSTLAFDATSVSQTGIQSSRKSSENCFAFIVLPLECKFPDILVHSMPHATGRIDRSVLQERDKLIAHMRQNGFIPIFIATDGDNGVANFHEQAYNRYADFDINMSLEDIVASLSCNGPLECWPISDFLHLLKNARTRIATGMLAFSAESLEVIYARGLNDVLELGNDLVTSKPLDLLRDDLALRVFTLGNLMKLWSDQRLTGVYFFMPFVALNLAIRNGWISTVTRLDLIEVAFSIFFRMLKEYPLTGDAYRIYEISRAPHCRKTLWTHVMCIRACNWCIGLYWALKTFDSLPLGRIGTHSVECHFGTTRSLLRGDTRWKQFLGKQADSIIIQRLLKELGLKPYIRRFKSVSGATIMAADDANLITVRFEHAAHRVERFATLLKNGADELTVFDPDCILLGFEELAEALSEGQYIEKFHRPSLTGGLCITNRYFAASMPKEDPGVHEGPIVSEEDIVFHHADDEVPEITE